jgi:hypothetical protein
MNANSTYLIGKDHISCEDYALAWSNPQSKNGLAIVCDGCSASSDVDFGARILAKSAENIVLMDGDDSAISDDANVFGTKVIFNAKRIFEILPTLHPNALDCTLLVARVTNDKKLIAFMYGDGVLVHRTQSSVNTVHISLTSGAPDYLSYQLHADRYYAYKAWEDNVKQIACTNYGKTIQVSEKPLTPYVLKCDVSEGDVIAVISDGINSFRKSDNEPIPWTDLVDEFTGFKNFEGEFVQRRIAAFKRKCLKEGITHSDDISVASIFV